MREGTKKTVVYEYKRNPCEICSEPSTNKISFLYENARSNPASSGYRGDDISWCSDAVTFACEEHKEEARRNYPEGMSWCSTFYIKKDEKGEWTNIHYVSDWHKIDETIEEPNQKP